MAGLGQIENDKLLALLMTISEVSAGEFQTAYVHYLEWIPVWRERVHAGDCTKQPFTCGRCIYEEYAKEFPEFKKLLSKVFGEEIK